MDTRNFFRKMAQAALGVSTTFTTDERLLIGRLATGEEEPMVRGWRQPLAARDRLGILKEGESPAIRSGFIFRSAQEDGITCPHGSTNLFHCLTEEEQVVYVRERTVS